MRYRKLRVLLHFLLVLLFVAACGTKNRSDDKVANVVMQVSRCSRLYTSEMQIHKIVTYSDVVRMEGRALGDTFNIPVSVGDRKLAVPIDVTVKAYIDFNGFRPEQVTQANGKLVLTLPDPKVEVSSSKVDHQNTRQYLGLMRKRFSQTEIDGYVKQGEESILSHLSSTSLLEDARQSAVRTLQPIVRKLGYRDENVTIRFRKEFSPDDWSQMIIRNDERSAQ